MERIEMRFENYILTTLDDWNLQYPLEGTLSNPMKTPSKDSSI